MATTAHHNEFMIDFDKKCTFFFCVEWNVIDVRNWIVICSTAVVIFYN